jgi:hypothetical protein
MHVTADTKRDADVLMCRTPGVLRLFAERARKNVLQNHLKSAEATQSND